MDKVYNHKAVEEKIYRMWEKGGYFTPKIDRKKKPFCIILPLPNANDPLHMGHALFTIEDILSRYRRMLGDPTLWLPGGDHAGIETQFVFEKHLASQDKSRFDYDRETLYQMIKEFADKNKNINKDQMKLLGFSLDWTRYHYSLEPAMVEKVLATFRKLHQDGLAYRGERLVNFCTHCGTAFSDLEVIHREKDDSLYYLNYGPVSIATARPETIFADVAVAVNPKDKRYQKLVGQKAIIPLIDRQVPIIEDELIDIDFGTGALKVTPAHDPVDYQIGQKHQLKIISCIDRSGKMVNLPEKYLGMTVLEARKAVVEHLEKSGKLLKTVPLKHSVGICYRCKTVIEPLLTPQWFIKMKPLAQAAIKAVKEGKTKIFPKKRFEKMYFDWLNNILDWNISRQIVWGPRIPVWYCLDCHPEIIIDFIDKNGKKVSGRYQDLKKDYQFEEIEKGLQRLVAPKKTSYTLTGKLCKNCHGPHVLQETDTFDTWFLSAQWPLTTLGYPDSQDFKYFYPTSVLDTLWDILFFWVARMMMLGLYLTKDVPFKVIHLHARVVDEKGQKMSKSRGNVVNPLNMVEKYGADALRMALVFGVSPASDIAIGDDKVRAMRNFANKLWNIGRFILSRSEGKLYLYSPSLAGQNAEDKKIIKDLNRLIAQTTSYLEKYRFDLAAEGIYHFVWHNLADKYLESIKERLINGDKTALAVLQHIYQDCLKLLHLFMPFITEEIWQLFPRKYRQPLIISKWPSVKK